MTGSIRARVRAQMIDEIKDVARRHLATDGANLSLRAVARDMGMVSSALYRYFANRDELLTALILDGYAALGAATERADAAVADRADLLGRWLACCHGIRDWALANPAEYALLFGSPVPGYAAPPETATAAARTPAVLIAVLADGATSGVLRDPGWPHPAGPVLADLAALRADFAPTVPEPYLGAALTAWMALFGAVSFELFGQLNNVIQARTEFFTAHVTGLAATLGIAATPG